MICGCIAIKLMLATEGKEFSNKKLRIKQKL